MSTIDVFPGHPRETCWRTIHGSPRMERNGARKESWNRFSLRPVGGRIIAAIQGGTELIPRNRRRPGILAAGALAFLLMGMHSHAASAVAWDVRRGNWAFAKDCPTVAEAEQLALQNCPGGVIIRSGGEKGMWAIAFDKPTVTEEGFMSETGPFYLGVASGIADPQVARNEAYRDCRANGAAHPSDMDLWEERVGVAEEQPPVRPGLPPYTKTTKRFDGDHHYTAVTKVTETHFSVHLSRDDGDTWDTDVEIADLDPNIPTLDTWRAEKKAVFLTKNRAPLIIQKVNRTPGRDGWPAERYTKTNFSLYLEFPGEDEAVQLLALFRGGGQATAPVAKIPPATQFQPSVQTGGPPKPVSPRPTPASPEETGPETANASRISSASSIVPLAGPGEAAKKAPEEPPKDPLSPGVLYQRQKKLEKLSDGEAPPGNPVSVSVENGPNSGRTDVANLLVTVYYLRAGEVLTKTGVTDATGNAVITIPDATLRDSKRAMVEIGYISDAWRSEETWVDRGGKQIHMVYRGKNTDWILAPAPFGVR